MGIEGKVVAITGASSGIGRATAKLLAERGAFVVLGARNEEALAACVDEIAVTGGKAPQVPYTLSDMAAAPRLENFIGGEWVAAGSGETFESVAPATGETLASFPRSGAADVDRAR